MTKAQALALVNALETATVPCSANLTFPVGGGETWSVSIPSSYTLTGAQLVQLGNYCAQQSLTLTAIFEQLGVT